MVSFLLTIGIAGFVFWLILRARSKLRRGAEEARARETAFLNDLAAAPKPPPDPVRAAPPAGTAGLGVAARVVPPAAATLAAGPGAYLPAPAAGVFRLLRAALPGHEIFPGGSLRRVLGPLAPGKDLPVDFVVCTADLRPVAVVDLAAPDDLPPVVTLKAERLASAGLAYARWDGAALPAAAEVATLLATAERRSA